MVDPLFPPKSPGSVLYEDEDLQDAGLFEGCAIAHRLRRQRDASTGLCGRKQDTAFCGFFLRKEAGGEEPEAFLRFLRKEGSGGGRTCLSDTAATARKPIVHQRGPILLCRRMDRGPIQRDFSFKNKNLPQCGDFSLSFHDDRHSLVLTIDHFLENSLSLQLCCETLLKIFQNTPSPFASRTVCILPKNFRNAYVLCCRR